mmetsp:Transcript_34962/g.84618  ORF Transcript_34962/g.84618 Transcript_34962/m.84618 type:complete len:96 (+) Transcript_34962:2258-2545(+)
MMWNEMIGATIEILPEKGAVERTGLFPHRAVVMTDEVEDGALLPKIRNCRNRKNPRETEESEESDILHPGLAPTPVPGLDLGTRCHAAKHLNKKG